MSKIIKAAELKVLIPNDTQTVIPVLHSQVAEGKGGQGTMLRSANLLQDAKQKAESIVEQAHKEAEALKQKAKEELDILRVQAKEAGFDEGYQEGLVEGNEQALQNASGLLSLLQATIEEGVRIRANSLQALEDDFLKFSLLLADKLVRRSISEDISWLTPIVKDALRSLGTVDQIQVRLNPLDFSFLQEREEGLQLATRAKLRFESDPTISPGGCLIESTHGLVDARLEKRLGKIAQQLMEVLYHEEN